MGLIRLDNDLQVQVPAIDAQHEAMIDLINRLHKAMTECSERVVLDQLIGALIAETQAHFDYEEQLMRQQQYPGYQRHKDEHDRLLAHIRGLADRYHQGELLLSFGVMVDLKGWALVHIEKFDVALGMFLNRTRPMPGMDASSPRNGTR